MMMPSKIGIWAGCPPNTTHKNGILFLRLMDNGIFRGWINEQWVETLLKGDEPSIIKRPLYIEDNENES